MFVKFDTMNGGDPNGECFSYFCHH